MVEGARSAVVVDDDPDVRLLLRVALESLGFVVHEAETGHDGVEEVRRVQADLVTLDLMLPGFSGVEVCRRIRQISDAYVIIISASADETDRLVGLATGADDYVVKPFSPREVQARVVAMFRRPRSTTPAPARLSVAGPARSSDDGLVAPPLPAPPVNLGFGPVGFGPPEPTESPLGSAGPGQGESGGIEPGSGESGRGESGRGESGRDQSATGEWGTAEAGRGGSGPVGFSLVASGPAGQRAPHPLIPAPREPEPEHGVVRHAQLSVDVEARVARYQTTELSLTKIEFDLLATLIGNPRRVWRRDTLLNIVWGGQWSDHHVVEVHIGNLRRKLNDAAGGNAQLIKTVRGIGYRMAAPDQQPQRPA